MTTSSDPSSTDPPRPWVSRVAGSLTHRNFRLLWFAALGSTIGTWMQKYAQSLLVLDLTGSAFYLGLDDFLSQLPILLFMLIGGVIADRYDRRRLLTGSQFVQAFSAFSLALLVFTGRATIWHVLALSFISGCGQAFGGPAYQSLIPSLVPRRDLPNAIALNSTQFNLSRVLGPMGGNAVLAALGTAACFTLNGLSFFFVVAALAMIRIAPTAAPVQRQALMTELRGGLNYVRRERLLLTLTALVFVSTFLTMPVLTFLPIFAKQVFGGNDDLLAAARLSRLMAAQGAGAITGALIIGAAGRFRHMGRTLLLLQVSLGVLIALFAMSRTLALSYALLFVVGVFFMALFSISFSIVQLMVPDELRGRVVSIYMVALRGGWPLGSLVAGPLADAFSAPNVMAVNGVLLSLVAGALLIFGRGHSLRQV